MRRARDSWNEARYNDESTVHVEGTTRMRETGADRSERAAEEGGENERDLLAVVGREHEARDRKRERTQAAPRGGMRWGLSGRKPSAVNI